MNNKQQNKIQILDNPLLSAIKQIEIKHPFINGKQSKNNADPCADIVDIITFCNSPEYLGFTPIEERTKDDDISLYPSQKVILKCFYMGTVGNENLRLSQDEWEWLYQFEKPEEIDGILYENNIANVIKKIHNKIRNSNAQNFRELHLVLGRRGSKCREENEIIATTKGSLTFRELCDRINNHERIGICTYDKKTLKKFITYEIKAQENGIVECFSVTTKRGIEEISSYNHPYLVWRDNWESPRFVKMSELMVGDKIAVANNTQLFGEGSIGINKAAILGHLQGRGETTHYISYSTESKEMLNDFKKLIAIEFPEYQVKYKSQYDYIIIKNTNIFKQNGSHRHEIKEWLIREGCYGIKSIDKEIPYSIFHGSKEEVYAFLSRLFSGDRWASSAKTISKQHSGVRKSFIEYCSSSKRMADGVRHLLQKFGIHATVNKTTNKCKGKNFHVWKVLIARKDMDIFYKETKVKEVIELSCIKGKIKSEFASMSKCIWNGINKNITSQNLPKSDFIGSNNGFLTNRGTSDIRWDAIKFIKPVGLRSTIALEVVGTNIIGGDLISHNTFIASIISAYEAYKLLTINHGDPHSYYKLPPDDEIAIINVALSLGQAGRLFGQLQSRIRNSPFFAGKVAKETTSEIRLYTRKDLEKKSKGANLEVPGSVLLLCGHSNPDSLAGYNAILILFDELAFYDETGKVTGGYFYTHLKPSLAHFSQFNEGRLVEISSPNTRMGIFYKIYEEAKTEDTILSFQLPTWCTNPGITYNHPDLVRDRNTNLEMFASEYGAQWASGSAYGNYFEEDMINRCIRGDIGSHLTPQPYINYYLHVDPAQGGNNYAAVMIAKKRYTNNHGEKRSRCILAGAWVWRPVPGLGLLFNEIDKEIVAICHRFHPLVVSYDDYQAEHSIQLLRSHGIHTMKIPFNRGVKAKIYQNLRNMMTYQPESELWLYDDGGESSLLINELKNLKWKQNQRGLSIIVDKHSDIKTDDLADSLAGAVSMATEGFKADLPLPVVVRTGWV